MGVGWSLGGEGREGGKRRDACVPSLIFLPSEDQCISQRWGGQKNYKDQFFDFKLFAFQRCRSLFQLSVFQKRLILLLLVFLLFEIKKGAR